MQLRIVVNSQVLKQCCLFTAETHCFFFLSNDSLAYEKIRQKTLNGRVFTMPVVLLNIPEGVMFTD